MKAKWVSNTKNSYLKENAFYEYLSVFFERYKGDWDRFERYCSDIAFNFLPYNGVISEGLLMDEDFLSENGFDNVKIISTDDSNYPIYVFIKCLEENKKYNIYYYSDANIIMSKDHILGIYNTVDLSLIDTSLMTDMSHMFEDIVYENLVLNNFDTSNVTNMSYMFANCVDIKILDLKYLNTGRVTDMSYMFYNDHDLAILNIDNFSDASLTNTEYMFYGCYDLNNISFDGFSGKTIENDKGMFCNKMKYGSSLNVTGYTATENNSNCSDMGY